MLATSDMVKLITMFLLFTYI